MGSALCFPVEAMVFYTLIQSAMHQLDGRRPSSRSIREYSEQIDIYGDDIIVPVGYADVVVNYLESYALKVNVNKSFRNSHFRESCGADYYKGHAVNPVYARMYPPDDSRHWGAAELMSWNATADLFYLRGKWHVAQKIREMLSRVTRRSIPRSRVIAAGLAHYSLMFSTGLTYSQSLHCWGQKRTIYQPSKKKDDIDGDDLACLNKWALSVYSKHRGYGAGAPGQSLGHVVGIPTHAQRYGSGSVPHSSVSGPSFSLGEGTCECGVRLEEPRGDSMFCDSCLESVPSSIPPEWKSLLEIPNGGRVSGLLDEGCFSPNESTRQEVLLQRDICLLEDIARDPLYYLDGRAEGLDFLTSTKRGGFKSKRRWTPLAVG